MKITGALSFLLLPLALCAGPITQKPLDEFVIYDIPVASKSGTTTVMFPSEISGLFAKSVASQEQENAGFLISFTPGNFYFSIRALKPDAEDHLTVIFNRKAYVLHLKASEQPFYNVTFYQDDRRGKDGTYPLPVLGVRHPQAGQNSVESRRCWHFPKRHAGRASPRNRESISGRPLHRSEFPG